MDSQGTAQSIFWQTGCGKRKRGDKNNYKVSELSLGKLQLTFTEIGKTVNKDTAGGGGGLSIPFWICCV